MKREQSKQIGTRVPLSLLAEMEALAEREHRTLANVVTMLCREAIDQRRKSAEGVSLEG